MAKRGSDSPCASSAKKKKYAASLASHSILQKATSSPTAMPTASMFSMCRKIDTDSQSQLGNNTLRALLSCKINTDNSCYSFVPEKDLLKSAKVETWDYVKVHQ